MVVFPRRRPYQPPRTSPAPQVKPEYQALHAIHSENWVEEEGERSDRWHAFLDGVRASLSSR